MTGRTIGTIVGLSLVVGGACTGSGAPNDFGPAPSDNAPRDPGAPGNPNEPPGNRNDPPLGGVAPPPSNGVPGDPPVLDCRDLCSRASLAGCFVEDQGSVEQCVESCGEVPDPCLEPFRLYAECVIAADCRQELVRECIDELDRTQDCLDPDPPDPPQGGQGNF